MDTIHFVAKDAALCGAADARWGTILRDTVTCAECRRRLADRDRGEAVRSQPLLAPAR